MLAARGVDRFTYRCQSRTHAAHAHERFTYRHPSYMLHAHQKSSERVCPFGVVREGVCCVAPALRTGELKLMRGRSELN